MPAAARVALVLGAGGPVGHAFHAGVLRALADGFGWDAREADLVIGTSAGAQTGALLRAGLSAHDLFARVTGEALSSEGAAITRSSPWPAPRAIPDGTRRWPAAPRYLRSLIRRPWLARPGRLIAALLPEGRHGSEALGEIFSGLDPRRWPPQPLWIPAVHLDTGARVVFGRPGAPTTDLGTAVRCSSAVPGLSRPVRIGQHRFVDGGIASATHVDLLAMPGPPRLVLVASPLSRFTALKLLLRAELRPLVRRGIRTALFEPNDETVAAMGWNPMDWRVARQVAEAAYRAARRRLESATAAPLRELLRA